MSNEFCFHFRVCRPLKDVSHVRQLLAQFVGVVDGTVVYQCDSTRCVRMWMSVFVRFASLRGPSSMGNPNGMTNRRMRMDTDQIARIGLVAIARKFGDCLRSVFTNMLETKRRISVSVRYFPTQTIQPYSFPWAPRTTTA